MNGLILAAGLGTRFRPFSDILPKPAIPLLNVPVALYNVHLLQQLGLDKLTVNTHHLPEKMKAIFSPEIINIPLFFSDEAGQILGTGGAIKKARHSLEGRGTFVVANADVVNGFGLRDALEAHHRAEPLATLVVMKHPEAGKKYGAVWLDKKNQVVDISRTRPQGNVEPYHFVGIHLIEESVFKYIPDGPCEITKDVYLRAITEGEKIQGYVKEGLWFDAGSLPDYLEATESLLTLLPRLQHEPYFLSLYRRFWTNFDKRPSLWEGEGCEHALSLGNTQKILMGNRCRIHPSAKINGFVVFGSDVVVEKDVELHNVVIGNGVHIPAGQKYRKTLVL